MRALRNALIAGAFVQAVSANADPVVITINQQTTFGTSVFATADHPTLGARQIRRAIKLSPHAYPVWSATVDLPPGFSGPVSFYLRTDSPDRLTDGGNGTLLPTTQNVSVPGPAVGAKRIEVSALASTTSAAAVVTSLAPGFTPVSISLTRTPDANGRVLYSGLIPAEHIAFGRVWQLQVDGVGRFQAPVRINPAPFRWVDSDTVTSAPRRETFTMNLTGFPSRQIKVLLPQGYDQNTTKRYPVIYAQDGQNVLSPGGAFGSWDLDVTVARLTRQGEIPEVIVVAIDNTNARLTEYRPEWTTYQGTAGRGAEFLRAIRDQLIPEVNARYRTLTGPEHTMHVGSSLGGILGWEAAHRFSDVFGTVAVMSPSFWLNTQKVQEDAALAPEGRARVWLDSGVAGTSLDGYADVIAARDKMLETGAALGPDFGYQYGYFATGAAVEPGHQHNEASWRDRSPDMLRWAFEPLMVAPADGVQTAWILGQ